MFSDVEIGLSADLTDRRHEEYLLSNKQTTLLLFAAQELSRVKWEAADRGQKQENRDRWGRVESQCQLIIVMVLSLFQCHILDGDSDAAPSGLLSLIIFIHLHSDEKMGWQNLWWTSRRGNNYSVNKDPQQELCNTRPVEVHCDGWGRAVSFLICPHTSPPY